MISSAPRSRVGAEARALLRLGLPLVGGHLAQMAIVVTDTVMIGWYDIPSLAAMSLAGPIWFIVFILGSGFAWAVMPMVAAAAARNDDRQIRRVTRMGLWLSIMYGFAVTPAFLFFQQIFILIGQEPEVARLGGVYMKFLGIATVPALLAMVLKSYLSALELTRAILVVMIVAAGLNVVIGYAFIFGNLGAPELGVAGAGIAAISGNLVAFIGLGAYAVWRRPEHELFRNAFRPDWGAFGGVFRLGWPIGLGNLAETGLFASSTVMMGWIGTIPLAAHGIALQIASLTFMVHMGLSQAITVRVGRAQGQGDTAELRSASIAAMGLSLAMTLATICMFLAIPEVLIGLFVDPTDPQRPAILVTGATLLAVAALFQLMDSGQVMALGMLRGVHDTRAPMVIAIVAYWMIGLPVSYVFGFVFGWCGVGIWLGLTAGLAAAAVLLHYRFWTRYALATDTPEGPPPAAGRVTSRRS